MMCCEHAFMRPCSVFTPPPNEPFDLAEVEAEVWLLRDRQGAWRQPRQYATHSVDVSSISGHVLAGTDCLKS